MKLGILTMLAAFLLMQAKAQELTGGIVAGAATGAVKITDIKNNAAGLIEGKNIYSIEAGLFAQLKFNPFYMKPMALINHQRGTVDIFTSETSAASRTFNQGKFELPLLFGLKFIGPLGVEAGPVYNYILYTTKNFDGKDVSVQRSGLGYRLGAGIELGRISLSAYYQGLVNKSGSNTSLSTYKAPYEFIFDIGLRLGK